MSRMIQRILVPIYQRIFRSWLAGDRVIHVKRWRTMRVEDKFGMRRTVTPTFWWFK